MITRRATQVQEVLLEAHRLKQAEAETNDLKNTLAELQELYGRLTDIHGRHRRIAHRIDVSASKDITGKLDELLSRVFALRSSFETDFKQATALRRLVNEASELKKRLDDAWENAANDAVGPYGELLLLVRALPEVQSRLPKLNQLIATLNNRARNTPDNDIELARFDQALAQLRDELGTIEGLTSPVQTFLRSVTEGSATLADVSDEVLNWCRQGDRARSFHLELTRRG